MWEEGEEIYIHSWVYNLDDGRLKDLNYTVRISTGL
jgi:carbonic anhydrase